MDTHAPALSLGLLSVGALIASPARAECPELPWRDGVQVAIGFDQSPTAAASIDLDGDGTVGARDLSAILSAWGACP
jgi:hypothetical protein